MSEQHASPRTATLGSSGIEVSRLALGTMMFGSWGNPDSAQCSEMVDIALDHGITLFDTADIYDEGESERILGSALHGRRDQVVLATKVGNPMDDDPAHSGLSPAWVHRACDDSLRRLGTDFIDLYQMHRPDPSTPIADTLGALHELVAAGKVLAIGTSTFTPTQLAEARAAGLLPGNALPSAEQPPYSILTRAIEHEVLPFCAANDIGVLVWAPLNGGWLTGKYQNEALDPVGRAVRQGGEHFDHKDEAMRTLKRSLVGQLVDLAGAAGLTIVELAMGFVLSNQAVTAMLLGPRTPAQLRDLLDAQHVVLSTDVLAAIDSIVRPGLTVNPYDDG